MDPGWDGSRQRCALRGGRPVPWLGSLAPCPSSICLGEFTLSFLAMSFLPSLHSWCSIPVPSTGRLGPPGSGRTRTGPGTAPMGLGRAVQPWGLKAIWQGMGEGAGGADVGRGIYPFLSFPAVSLHIHLPCSPTPPQVMPLPKGTEQSIAQTSSGCLEHLHSHKPCLVLSEMRPLLAREGGHLWPLHHPCAGDE